MTSLPLSEEKISGNIVPHSWYKIFKTCNKPDLVAITILAEVLFKYRTGQVTQDKWRVSYGYFENKFDFSKNQIRAALTRLEAYKVVTREVKTESHNDRKYGGVLYLIYSHQALQLIQKNFISLQKKLTPPCEKSDSNKRSNKIILNIKDVEKINESSSVKYSLTYCQETLIKIQERYPNLIFSTKFSLLEYLKKTLRSYNKANVLCNTLSNSSQKEINLDLDQHLNHFDDSIDIRTRDKPAHEIALEFNQSMSIESKNVLPKEIHAKIKNSFLMLGEKDGCFTVKILCYKSLVFPYHDSLTEIAKNILKSANVSFEYLEADQPSNAKLFAILKLKLYFTHGLRMYSSWFKHLDFGYFQGNEWVLFTTNKFIKDWIDEHYKEEILSCIHSFHKEESELQIQVQNFNKS